jgi:hypothetical protein
MKRNPVPDLNFPNLKRLAEERPTKMMKALRLVWPRIKGALEGGETLRTIHGQVTEMGITISYKVLQIYVGRLRREDRLKNRQLQSAAKPASRQSKVPLVGRRMRKPTGFVVPAPSGPMLMDLTCWICGLDNLSCRCSRKNPLC